MSEKEQRNLCDELKTEVATDITRILTKWLVGLFIMLMTSGVAFYYNTNHNIKKLIEQDDAIIKRQDRLEQVISGKTDFFLYDRDLTEVKRKVEKMEGKLDDIHLLLYQINRKTQ